MAKRSGMYKFEKRNKEIKRKKKQEEKLRKRQEKDRPAGSGPEIDYSLCTTAEAAGVDLTEFIEGDDNAAEEEGEEAEEEPGEDA